MTKMMILRSKEKTSDFSLLKQETSSRAKLGKGASSPSLQATCFQQVVVDSVVTSNIFIKNLNIK